MLSIARAVRLELTNMSQSKCDALTASPRPYKICIQLYGRTVLISNIILNNNIWMDT